MKGKRGREWCVSVQQIDPGQEMERKRERQAAKKTRFLSIKEKVSTCKPADHFLTGRAVCLAWPAGLGRLLGMTRFNAVPFWAANGSYSGSKAVYHSTVTEQEEPATCGEELSPP